MFTPAHPEGNVLKKSLLNRMYLLKSLKFACISALATLPMAPLAQAQTTVYRLPGQHNAEHQELIAGQMDVKDQVKIESVLQLMDSYFTEEEEPELDIYEENWNSILNCYNEKDVPQTKILNVSKFCMPHSGYMTSPYGYRRRFRRMHKGVDLKVQIGDTIRAAFDGKVRIAKNQGRRKGFGLYVVIRHANELETVYGHLSKFLVEPDQYVKAGDPIALGGNTGHSTGPHLHFETRFMGYAINPAAIFDFANQTVHTDEYTFDKRTYKEARNFSPDANRDHQRRYMEELARNPRKVPAELASAGGSSSSSSKGASSYTIRKGDSLSKIASRTGTTVKTLCRLNGITTSTILQPGKKLKLR